jgi:hypothetical protein
MSEYYEKDSYTTLVKSLDSYGINIISSYGDFTLSGKQINSNPLVYFYDSFNKVIIDYTQTNSDDDLEYLEFFLQGITNGNTFSISDSYYVKEQDGITSNLDGIYQYDGSTGNNMIFATKVSATKLNTGEFRYEKDYFVDSLQLSLNSGFTGDTANIIKSVTNSGSVVDLGLYEDDLIQISYSGITQNVDRFKVEKVETTSDGEEIIFLKDSIVSENRIGKLTTLEVYSRGRGTVELLNADKTINGSAKIYNKNGVYLNCFDYQNQLQAYLRRYNENDPNLIVNWSANTLCDGVTDSILPSNGVSYNTLVDVKTQTSSSIKKFCINGQKSPNITLVVGTVYLFYQGHFTNRSNNIGEQLVFTRVQGNTDSENLLTEFYTINSFPGEKNSYIRLNVTPDIPSTFYYESLTTPNMGGTISVNTSAVDTTNVTIGQYIAANFPAIQPIIYLS